MDVTNQTSPGEFEEIGTPGLEAWYGYIQQAYHRDLDWPGVYPLYNRLRRSDPEVTVVRQLFAAMIGQVRFKWEQDVEKPTEDDKRALEFAESVLDDIEGGADKFLDTLVSYVPFLGWGWWEAVPGVRHPDWVPPANGDEEDEWRSQYDDGLIGFRRLAWRDHSAFMRWDISERTGKLKAMVQMDQPNPERSIPLDRSLHIVFGDLNNPEGLTPCESVWRIERIKYGLEVVQGIGYEHAAGYLEVRAEKDTLTATDHATIRKAAKAIMSAQEANYAAWPKGLTGELKDVPFQVAGNILETIRYYGLLKLAVFNAQWVGMSSISDTGSYSALKDASSTWLLFYNAMLAGFARQVDAQLGKRLFQYNPNAFPQMTKRPRLTVTKVNKVIDLQELGTFWNQIRNTMPVGEDDFLEIRRRSGFLPESAPDEEETTNDPAPADQGQETDDQEAKDQEQNPTDEGGGTAEMSSRQQQFDLAMRRFYQVLKP